MPHDGLVMIPTLREGIGRVAGGLFGVKLTILEFWDVYSELSLAF